MKVIKNNIYLLFLTLSLCFINTEVNGRQIVEDTLDWKRYFPMQIGNEWHYDRHPGYQSWKIINDTLIDSEKNYELEIKNCNAECDASSVSIVSYLLRYDTVNYLVSISDMSQEGNIADNWFSFIPCGLNAPLNSFYVCTPVNSGLAEYWVFGDYNAYVTIQGESVVVSVRKDYSFLGGGSTLASDIGLISAGVEISIPTFSLLYARINGKTYGSPVVALSAESKVSLDESGIVSVYPNPFYRHAYLVLNVKTVRPIKILLSNIVGQLVKIVNVGYLSPGRHEIRLDGSDVAPGVYLLNVQFEKSHVSKLITVIK